MSYLERIIECNQYSDDDKIPFTLDHKQVGQIRKKYKRYLLESGFFVMDNETITLPKHLTNFDDRTAALKAFSKKTVDDKISNVFMNENFPVLESFSSKPMALIDRNISSLLGLRSFGQHLNAYVMTEAGMKMWIGKRAYSKGFEPGKLDHMVAGGLPYDISPTDNLIKECYEEAGMSEELARQAKSVGFVSYKFDYSKGGKEDLLYCYDIELSEDFIPVCTDGEVEAFYLMSIEEVATIVRTSNDFKQNCNLVIIDFLVRHGYIGTEDENYIEIVNGLRI